MTEHPHVLKQFDTDLDGVRSSVLAMGGLVEQQNVAALETFRSGDTAAAARVIENDWCVNTMEVGIDEECATVIARRHPTAGDLRLLIAIGRIITDLERTGDEAAKIARMAQLIHASPAPATLPPIAIDNMADMALDMLQRALDALARFDPTAAAAVHRQDEQVDDQYRSVIRQTLAIMMQEPASVTTCMRILFIAKAIERIGDHAKNIAEHVVYLVYGNDVRHANFAGIPREAAGEPH